MNLFVGLSGASGFLYAADFLQKVAKVEAVSLHISITDNGLKNLQLELDNKIESLEQFVHEYNIPCKIYDSKDLGASVSSGSYPIDKYLFIPASMGFVGRVSSGVSINLLERCADVAIKEKRPLVIAFRESPLSIIHLNNLSNLSQAGATITPLAPGFYSQPKTIQDILSFMTGRICDFLDIEIPGIVRWK